MNSQICSNAKSPKQSDNNINTCKERCFERLMPITKIKTSRFTLLLAYYIYTTQDA